MRRVAQPFEGSSMCIPSLLATPDTPADLMKDMAMGKRYGIKKQCAKMRHVGLEDPRK